MVAAAISLRGALEDAAAAFAASRPDARVDLHTGGSGLLTQQMMRGAPVDLFVSASPRELDRLENAGRLLPGSRVIVAANRLVVVAPAGPDAPWSVKDLRTASVRRLAIGNPRTAPVGWYAEQALRRRGSWEALRGRVVPAEDARQALEYALRGEVDAAVVYQTDARLAGERLVTAFELPGDSHDPILYEAAVLRDAAQRGTAREFLLFLGSPAGRQRLAAHGFLPPPAP